MDGKPWYFRARSGGWYFTVADDPLCPDAEWVCSIEEPGYLVDGEYVGDANGYMDEDDAWALIATLFARFRREHGASRTPDGMLHLYRCLYFNSPRSLDAWEARWRQGGREPVAASWAECTRGLYMAWVLGVLADWGLAAPHVSCPECPRPDAATGDEYAITYGRALAEHLRQVIPGVPSLERIRANWRSASEPDVS